MLEDLQHKLDQLGNLKYKLDVINLQYDALKEKILTPEIVEQLREIDAERKTALEAAQAGIAQLEQEVKFEVLACGQSVKGALMKATYVKGRESWDTKSIDAYAKMHPEINVYKKVGEPSVRLELIK